MWEGRGGGRQQRAGRDSNSSSHENLAQEIFNGVQPQRPVLSPIFRCRQRWAFVTSLLGGGSDARNRTHAKSELPTESRKGGGGRKCWFARGLAHHAVEQLKHSGPFVPPEALRTTAEASLSLVERAPDFRQRAIMRTPCGCAEGWWRGGGGLLPDGSLRL
jgi:hypothetical protein